jgi:hypothetical protein
VLGMGLPTAKAQISPPPLIFYLSPQIVYDPLKPYLIFNSLPQNTHKNLFFII